MSDTPATTLLAAFRSLTDPRQRRGVRHPYASALALIFLGLLARQSDFAALARWARRHWKVLRGPLGFTRRYAPHATTLSRLAARFCLEEFQQALCRWLACLPQGPTIAAVDGKTSKQGYDADGDPIHMLNVFAHDLGVCLASWPVGEGKETEPEVLKAHLAELLTAYPSLRVLTGDALFCQRPLARLILEHGADYLLAIKDNQPDLHEAAQATFAGAAAQTADAQSVEKKRGAVVTRRLWWDAESAAYARETLNFPGLRLLLRVDSEERVAGEVRSQETRYFAASFPEWERTADEVLGRVRGHWGVENRLHFVKDRWWDEDRHYLSRPGLAERFAVLTGAALAVLQLTRPDPKLPLRAWADELSGDVEQALKLLTEEIL